MDDQMMDLMAGDELLRRRLMAYADLRLSPDLTTSSRLRARVMAVAHRHASLARADAGLTLLPRPDGVSGAHPADESGVAARAARRPSHARHGRRQRALGVVLAASLAAVMVAGGVYAARPGGPIYETRLWAETLALPSDPPARALAELDRLRERLREIGEASRAGDTSGLMAALAAYESIVEEASASAILSDDDVAAAVLEAGVGRNVEVLRALAGKVPTTAGIAISRAVDAAIARSADAVERINASRPGAGPDNGAGGGPANPPRATKAPTAEPTPESVSTATPKPKPTHKAATPKPTPTPTPTATPDPKRTPDRTPKPRVNQGEAGPPATTDPQPGGDSQDEDD
jgi:hypothetical protein